MQKEFEQKEINQTIHFHCGCGGAGQIPYIGENGNWFIGDEDTGIKAQGEDGKSAYDIAVENGFLGTADEWLESLKGEAGSAGPQGEAGPAGPQGVTGPVGSFANMDIIFNGSANEKDKAYPLLKPITDYKVLVIEYNFFCPSLGNIWTRDYNLIFDPRPSSAKFEHGGSRGADLINGVVSNASIEFHFPTATSIYLDTINFRLSTKEGKISKIHGIR